MPKRIPMTKMREWLEAYELGESEAAIAKKTRSDLRTVRSGIQGARRQRDAHLAQAELLKDALRQHQNGLLGLIRDMMSALVFSSPDLERRHALEAVPPSISIPGGVARYEIGQGWTVVLHVEDMPLWVLLQDHLRRDPVWDALAKWKKALVSHIEAEIAFKRKLGTLLEEKTGYNLQDEPASPPFLISYILDSVIYHVARNKAFGIPDGTNLEDNIVIHTATGEVRHRPGGTTLATAPGAEEECRRNIIDAFKAIQVSPEPSRLARTYADLREAAAKAKQAAQEIEFLGLVPGQCRVCRRLGL